MTTDFLEVRRTGGQYPLQEVRARFDEYGLVVLKEYLAPAERTSLRAKLDAALQRGREKDGVFHEPMYPNAEFLLGDVLAMRELADFDYIFFRPDLRPVLHALLDTQSVFYYGDSSVQFGEGARGFHKDNVDRLDGTKSDWQGPYRLLRCGFYCQDHLTHSGGLKVRLRSHKVATHHKGQIADITSRFGDLVVWNMRLTHSGNNKRVLGLPGVRLHPRVEMVWPAALTAPEQDRRIGAFCSFASAGENLDRYIDSLNRREVDYKQYFRRARKPSEARALVTQYGLEFRQPNQYYGELD